MVQSYIAHTGSVISQHGDLGVDHGDVLSFTCRSYERERGRGRGRGRERERKREREREKEREREREREREEEGEREGEGEGEGERDVMDGMPMLAVYTANLDINRTDCLMSPDHRG